jgi:hypothetical protein
VQVFFCLCALVCMLSSPSADAAPAPAPLTPGLVGAAIVAKAIIAAGIKKGNRDYEA